MELPSKEYPTLHVNSYLVGAIYVQDDDSGDVVYIDREQAGKLVELLKNFAETGEVPE